MALTQAEIDEGYGMANADIVNGQMHMVFNRPAALDDGTIPIESNFALGSDVASAFGYSSITISSGTYNVNFSTYPDYGEAYFNCTFS